MWLCCSMHCFTIGIRCQALFCMIVLIIAGTEASGFSFTNPPKCKNVIYQVALGQDLVLDCRTTDSNSKSTLYFWSRPINLSKIRYTSKASVYTIPNIGVSSGGLYNCTAENLRGQKISWQCIVTLSIFKLSASFVNKPVPYCHHLAGQSFNITCKVKLQGFDASSTKIEIYMYKWVNNAFTKVPDRSVIRSTASISRTVQVSMPFKQALAMPPTIYKCIANTSLNNQLFTSRSSTMVTVRDLTAAKIVNFPSSKSIVLKPSQQMTFQCSATGFPEKSIVYKWFKNGRELKQCMGPGCASDGYTWQQVHCSCQNDKCPTILTILSARYPEDEGTYACSATNGYGSPDRKSVRAIFHFAPQIDKSGTKVVQQVNKPQNMSCRTTQGNPLPTFTWLNSPMLCVSVENCNPTNKWLPIESNHLQRPSASIPTSISTITIPASMVHSFYKCVATSSIGKDHHVFMFLRSRRYNPSVAIKSLDVFNAGESLNVSCIVSDGTFSRWYKDGRKIYPSRDPRVVVIKQKKKDVDVVTLTIINLTTRDSGLYACKARDYDRTPMKYSKLITVKALFAPNITSLPNITAYYYFHNKTNIQLTCHVTANPKPRVTWIKPGSNVTALNSVENCEGVVRGYYLKKMSDGIGNTLLICDAYDGHTGLYTCLAENSKGNDNKTAYVDVLTPPRIKTEKSYELLLKPPGESVDILCQATGNPKPVVVWTKQTANGSTITLQGKRSNLHFATLEITKLGEADFGNYTCTATNSRGSDRMLIEIRADPAKETAFLAGTSPKILIIAAGAGGSVGFILFITILVCFVMSRRQKRLIEEYKAIKYLRKGEDYKLDPDRTILEQCEDLPYDADWEFPVKRLIFHGVIGAGSFGQVMKAEAIGILSFTARDKASDAFKRRSRLRRRLSSTRLYQDSAGRDYNKTTVAVKSLKPDAKESDYKDLATELKIMIHLGEHTNIINLLGACTRTMQLMVVMEFAPHGNLLNFLRSRREVYEPTWRKAANNPEAEFTLADLVMYTYQIARGMDFLSSKKCVHRDLAARNILVGDDYVMKIADFGLARDIYKTDLYIKETTGLLPIKWMAPESLFDRVYTQKTDVWSFGVVLWESQTLGGTPYPGVPVGELIDYLSEGKRMRQPRDCPPEIYAIMRDCWLHKPEERPTFSELVRRIERILEKKISGQENDSPYISVFMDEDLHRIYYMEPKDASSEANPVTSTSSDETRIRSMTEEEIKLSPLPPIPCPSLENIHELPLKENSPYYCDPVDESPTRSLPRGERNSKVNFYQNDHRSSGASTGVESGIELDDAFQDQSLERRNDDRWNAYNHRNRLSEPVDASGVSLLDPSVVKDKTKETML